MHPSSYDNMAMCRDRFLTPEFLARGIVTVLDIGSCDVSGSYKPLFADRLQYNYLGVDLAPGPNVDLVLVDPYKIPLRDGFADVIISGQMLEHCEFFWLAFTEMMRVLRPDGYVFLIAPSSGPPHGYPVDCWRFYPDAYPALAKWAGCECVQTWMSPDEPWKDMVGVFRHRTVAGKPD